MSDVEDRGRRSAARGSENVDTPGRVRRVVVRLLLSSRKIAPLCQQGRRFLCGRVAAQSVRRRRAAIAQSVARRAFGAGRAVGRLAGTAWPDDFCDAGHRGAGRHARGRSGLPSLPKAGAREVRMGCSAKASAAFAGAASGKGRPGREVPGATAFAARFGWPLPSFFLCRAVP